MNPNLLQLLYIFFEISVSIEEQTFMAAVRESPASLITALINLISIWSIIGLSGFHTYLIAINQTTNEDLKGTFAGVSTNSESRAKNPYSRGNCLRNILGVLCASEHPR